MMGFSPLVGHAIEALDEHWDGGGRPKGLSGTNIPIGARIALLAQVIDVFGLAHGGDAARDEIRARSGSWFDPDLVRAALPLIEDGFWSLDARKIEARVMAHAPAQDAWLMDEDMLDEMVSGFARVIDTKSPFTHGNSSRVALYTDLICARLDASDRARRWMRRAALLHDLGKLGISNRLLDKPEKLTDAEFDTIKTHPGLGRAVLGRIDIFAPLAAVAGAHHERLDGTGYPKGLGADALGWEMRVVSVADVFDALSADRPYRKALPVDQVWSIMDGMAGTALDAEYMALLKRAVAETPELGFE
jgi:HD-GYP domain-containing protein (c-di-GMP phosphodiesterase class II)